MDVFFPTDEIENFMFQMVNRSTQIVERLTGLSFG